MLEEKISRHLGVPFVEIMHEGERKYLCCNGVLFTDSEYEGYPDLQLEYERREKEDKLYDYAYAKSTGLLRKKRSVKTSQTTEETAEENESLLQKDNPGQSSSDISERREGNNGNETIQGAVSHSFMPDKRTEESERADFAGRLKALFDRQKEERKDCRSNNINGDSRQAVMFIILLLTFTSLISGYISTLHTATYLFDYVDVFSAWLMSASVTAYNATAFEVAVMFKVNKRYALALLFITLWGMVTLFSMATTVSVFYDRFNFTETQIAEENKSIDSGKLELQLLQTKEKDLREAIEFKKKDIEYRQEREYATTAVRKELNDLQSELQKVLSQQQKILSETPEVTQTVSKRKESLFSFLGRLCHIEGGIMEFIMSTLSAVFINLITPFSLIAMTEIKKTK